MPYSVTLIESARSERGVVVRNRSGARFPARLRADARPTGGRLREDRHDRNGEAARLQS